jgi:hypothetical protein
MRVDSEFYRGIEFIRISSLPSDQKEKIQSTLAEDKLIKILKDGVLVDNCIQYSDYLIWFEEHHQGNVITRSHSQQTTGVFKFSIK